MFGLLLCLLAVVAAVIASLALGSKPIPFGSVVEALTSASSSDNAVIVRTLRIPRTLLGIEVGAALGMAGAVMQGLTRNPLADPGLLGISAGASFAVAVGIFLFGITALTTYVWFAFAGAAVAAVAVYVIGSHGRSGATPTTLVLTGAALTALLGSFTSAIVLMDARTFDAFRYWVVGSLAGRDPQIVAQVLPFLLAGAVVALACTRGLNTMSLGDDMARSLGARLMLIRAGCGIAVTVLTGAAVAAAGPIAFVGLAVPHMARRFTGPDHRWLLPYSALLAAALLLAADVAGRLVAIPSEVQAGVITALVGAPFLIVLVRRSKVIAG